MDNIAPLDTSIDDQEPDDRFANVAPLSDDWYHGHKVVAMPSSAFGGRSIREVVSSRNNEHHHHHHHLSLQHDHRPRQRSSSLGRKPMIGGERRDLVQDVYDRMGVSYSRGGGGMATSDTSHHHYHHSSNHHYNSNNRYEHHHQQQQQQQHNNNCDTPMAIQSQPSFSDSIASSITNSVQHPQQQQQQYIPSNNGGSGGVGGGGGKMKDKFSGRYRAAAAIRNNTGGGGGWLGAGLLC